ncbi:septation protein A [Shewanella sp. A14]
MKQLLDFLPLVIFFVVYKFYDIYAATGVLIAATAIQLVVTYWLYKHIEKMHLATFAMVTVFGSLTLFFHDDTFIKWKVSIVYALFAIGLIASQIMGKPALKSMLGKEMKVDDRIWTQLTWYWVCFFVLCGLANIYIAFNLPLETWVNFKVFGLTALTLANTVITVVYLYRNMQDDNSQTTDGQ